VARIRQLRNGGFQAWHGHLAREKRPFSHEMPQEITGKMPVPRYFATPASNGRIFLLNAPKNVV
jgi:hypothetical protein